ncbi:MAG: helix-turn-helix transcriptional regulator [Alphaproteobacteria bacterium]|nr:helix-turn-helix transcriptional regulator [Alphaproteobacteria bacterium]
MARETAKKVASFLKEMREKKNVSQDKLSFETGISKVAIQNLEWGKTKNPKLHTLLDLCKALNVSFSDLAKRLE